MNFIVYDLIFLGIFAVFIASFLFINRKNLKKEGLLFLYKASWGIKLINYIGKKNKKLLHFLSYISIGLGYFLMATMLYLFGRIIYLYIAFPAVVKAIKVPPIIPLVPYLPQIFKLDFLPDFYFTYWIVILAVIAISHEFAHGIFAAANKVRIKSTGFGFFPFFLPVFLAAFVEQDDKDMTKKSKFSQMAILSAGTFANILSAILFFGVLLIFFSLMFTPAGVIFNGYATAHVPVQNIDSINGVGLIDYSYEEILGLLNKEGFSEIEVDEETYVGVKGFSQDGSLAYLYHDSPAINAKLQGAISEINGEKITNKIELKNVLDKYSAGDEIFIRTITDQIEEYEIVLEDNPYSPESSWLGIEFVQQRGNGIMGKVYSILGSFRDPHVYYKPVYDGWSNFVYNLLWWLVLISLSVALVNMLPVGIFDGGRFFYLTVWGITKNEKIARKAFGFVTYMFLFLLLLVMAFWAKGFFF